MKTRLTVDQYISGIKAGNINVLGRAITLVESKSEEDNELSNVILDKLIPLTGNAVRIGITGAPGVGKSTFIGQFGQKVVEQGHKLAVLAIDPSSSRSGGSILGDKTRMSDLLQLPEVFVRPSPAGDSLGGVARKTREAMLLCEAAGYDYIMIETVGTGQSEIEVKNMVDYLLLLLPPLGGDELQGIKKGVVELANGLIITKSDGNNVKAAKNAAREYRSALHILDSNHEIMIHVTSAVDKTGLQETYLGIEQFLREVRENGELKRTRDSQMVDWMHRELKSQLIDAFYSRNQDQIKDMEQKILKQHISPRMAVKELRDGEQGR